jgi:hypothetical protein
VVASPTFGDKASGQLPAKERALPRWALQIEAAKAFLPPHGPFICRLCGMVAEDVAISVRNVAEVGFRAFPACADRQACRQRREQQGKSWPLIDASFDPVLVEGDLDDD